MPFTVYVSAGSMKSGCEVCEIVIDPPFLASPPPPPPPPPPPSSSSPPHAAMTDMERAARRSTSARLPSFPIQNPSRFVSTGRCARRREDTPPAGVTHHAQWDKNLPLTQEFLAHHRKRLADQTRDVHLRETDPLGDLRLRQALLEAHPQDLPLARREPLQGRLEGGAVLRALEAGVLAADRLQRVELVLSARPRRERHRRVRRPDLHRLEHLLRRRLQLLGDLGDAGRAPEPAGQALDRAGHRRVQLLERPWDPDRPALVAEVALDLADHVGGGVGGDRNLALELEAVD